MPKDLELSKKGPLRREIAYFSNLREFGAQKSTAQFSALCSLQFFHALLQNQKKSAAFFGLTFGKTALGAQIAKPLILYWIRESTRVIIFCVFWYFHTELLWTTNWPAKMNSNSKKIDLNCQTDFDNWNWVLSIT